jgi:hypothetical protein
MNQKMTLALAGLLALTGAAASAASPPSQVSQKVAQPKSFVDVSTVKSTTKKPHNLVTQYASSKKDKSKGWTGSGKGTMNTKNS